MSTNQTPEDCSGRDRARADEAGALEALRNSEIRYRRLFESAKDGILILDAETGMVTDVNPYLLELLGYSRTEVLRKKVWELGFLADVVANEGRFAKLRQTKYVRYDNLALEGQDGRRHEVEFVSNVYPEGSHEVIQCNIRDISERKQAEKELKESEGHLRSTLDGLSVHIAVLDDHGEIILTNKAYRDFGERNGVKPGAVSEGANYLSVCETASGEHSEEAGPFADGIREVLSGKRQSFELEYPCHSPEEKRWFVGRVTPIQGEGPRRVVIAHENITERKQAAEAQRHSNELMQYIIEHTNSAVAVHDRDLRYMYVSDRYLKDYGVQEQDIIGKHHYDVFPDLPEKWREVHRKALAGEVSSSERDPYERADGTVEWTRWECRPWYGANGSIDGIIVYTEVITERVQAEEALRKSEEKFKNLVETISDVIFEVDAQGTVTYVSPSGLKIWGGTMNDVVGKNFIEFVHPDDREQLVNRFVELQQGIERPMIYRFVDPSGRILWGRSNSTPIWENGRFAGARGTLMDITAQKEAEAEKEKLQQKLLQAQKMESVGRLAGGVAHDFNNMLSVILGYTEMALEQVDPGQPLHSGLQEIQKAARRSADITRQLLAFARKQTIAPKVLDLNATVEGMLKMLRRLIGEDIDLVWQPATDLWPVRMDPSQVDQIMANLCVNARDAIEGVGRITIQTGKMTLTDADCNKRQECVPGDFVWLTFSDDGCGMDPQTLTNLFEPFFTTKDVDKGTGLGLATVYGIVKQNNGFITVESQPGRGTTFKIHLPRHEAAPPLVLSKDPAAADALGKETLLLVEDEPTILRMTTMMLQRLGYRVLPADNPEHAIAKAAEHPDKIHLLITDVVMPGMNGRELSARLRERHPEIKVLFMSGYTADVIAHRGVLDEGVRFIQKPFSKKDLAAKVREVLETS